MAQVTGVGGVFLRSTDAKALYSWYEQHLGLKHTPGGLIFLSQAAQEKTVVAFFPQNTSYFGKQEQGAMLNLRVDDLDAMLEKLTASGVEVEPKREDHEFGRFGWFRDPEGNRVELWQAPSAKH